MAKALIRGDPRFMSFKNEFMHIIASFGLDLAKFMM